MNRKASYSLHIQPLFTASQRTCMLGKFDLNKYEDFRQWAGKIASSLANKTMPADDSKVFGRSSGRAARLRARSLSC